MEVLLGIVHQFLVPPADVQYHAGPLCPALLLSEIRALGCDVASANLKRGTDDVALMICELIDGLWHVPHFHRIARPA